MRSRTACAVATVDAGATVGAVDGAEPGATAEGSMLAAPLSATAVADTIGVAPVNAASRRSNSDAAKHSAGACSVGAFAGTPASSGRDSVKRYASAALRRSHAAASHGWARANGASLE